MINFDKMDFPVLGHNYLLWHNIGFQNIKIGFLDLITLDRLWFKKQGLNYLCENNLIFLLVIEIWKSVIWKKFSERGAQFVFHSLVTGWKRFPNDIFCLLIGKTDLVALKKLLVSDLPKTMDFELPFLQSARKNE